MRTRRARSAIERSSDNIPQEYSSKTVCGTPFQKYVSTTERVTAFNDDSRSLYAIDLLSNNRFMSRQERGRVIDENIVIFKREVCPTMFIADA